MKCLNPIIIRRTDGFLTAEGYSAVEVPCGHCAACRKQRTKEWAVRMMLESLYHDKNCFVTLTYDNDFLPSNCSLSKRDLQLFFKRLRKDVSPTRFKYYACGEYGGRTERPHYHMILFGLGVDSFKVIDTSWSKGIVDIDTINIKACNYVSGYVQKKLYGSLGSEVYGDRVPPFSLMSKGIGFDYCIEHADDILSGVPISFDGQIVSIPRYFLKKISEVDSVDVKIFKSLQAKASELSVSRKLSDLGFDSPSGSDILKYRQDERRQRSVDSSAAEKLFSSRSKI